MKSYKIRCESCSAVAVNGTAVHETGCHGVMLFRYRGKDFAKWQVWSLDVWGNRKDGFEVNDRRPAGMITVPTDSSDAEIVRALKKIGFLNPRARIKSFRIDGDDRALSVDYCPDGEMPVASLERV